MTRVRLLTCGRVEADEVWTFVGAKDKNVSSEEKRAAGYGDSWTWTGICAETKLIISWIVTGDRCAGSAHDFMYDLASRCAKRIQLTPDGLKSYLDAIHHAFGNDVDHAVLVKQHGKEPAGPGRYSPPVVTGTVMTVHCGSPNKKISTSYR